MFNTILAQVLPRNPTTYNGHIAIKAAFAALILLTLFRSLAHMLLPDGGAQSIATIPLDTFSDNAANTVVLIFGYWGLSQLLIGLLYVGVLLRYPGFIPLMYLLAFVEYLIRLLIAFARPDLVLIDSAPGETSNYLLTPLMLLLFAASI